mgnify:CR=1 FL=1
MGIIEKLNQRYEENGQEENTKEYRDKAKALEEYLMYEKENKSFTVSFNVANSNGDLEYLMSCGVRLVLEYEVFHSAYQGYGVDTKDLFLSVPLIVRVKEIKGDTIYLESAKRNIYAAVRANIEKKLKKGEEVLVHGQVTEVTDRSVKINIFNLGFVGIIPTKYWRKDYTRNLADFVSVGEDISAYIFKHGKIMTENDKKYRPYIMSRIELTPDPWDTISDSIDQDSTIVVKCIEIPNGKTYFWGTSPAAKGIEIMCDFGSGRFPIIKGEFYRCKIRVFDKANKKFQATPFRPVAAQYVEEPVVNSRR